MSDGVTEPMIRIAVGSREELDAENMTNVQHYSFWLDELQPGEIIVQAFDYAGRTYRIVIENWTYKFKGGDTMNAILSPYQETLDNYPNNVPLTQSL